MKKLEIKSTIYKTVDGFEYEHEADAISHENQLKYRLYYQELQNAKIFIVTEKHIKLLKSCNIDFYFFNNKSEQGTFSMSRGYPYGNSDIYEDIANILDIIPEVRNRQEYSYSDNQYFEIWKLHCELYLCVQFLCTDLSINEGTYKRNTTYEDWFFVL